MAAVKAEDFVKDIYTNSSNDNNDGGPQYLFDSKKEAELKRLNEQHFGLLELQRDRLIHAPLDRPKRILDIACGTGITTVTIARKFPDAQVIGIDISPVPEMQNKPANVTFMQGKIEDIVQSIQEPGDDVIFKAGSFDYIFARLLVCVVSNWPDVINTCYTLLAPGGWLEMHEPAGYEVYNAASGTKPLSALPGFTWTWGSTLYKNSSALGYDVLVGKSLQSHFLASGLNNVSSVHYPWTPYPWPERPETMRMGKYMLQYGPQGYPAMLKMFTPNASAEERSEWERQIAEMSDPEKGGEGLHWRFYVVCGRKE